jgi:hypothetical protein
VPHDDDDRQHMWIDIYALKPSQMLASMPLLLTYVVNLSE